MNSLEVKLSITLKKSEWRLLLKHVKFLSHEFKSTEIKIEKHFIDFRRISPVPRCHITRIFYRSLNSKIEIYRCTFFSIDGSKVPGTSELLRQDIELLLTEFINQK